MRSYGVYWSVDLGGSSNYSSVTLEG